MKKILPRIINPSNLVIGMLLVTLISLAGCADSKSANTMTAGQKEPVFDLYKQVSLGMSKEQVDSTLGVPAIPDTTNNIKGMYNYKDKNDKYGVLVAFNEKNQAFSKTVIYGSHAVLAPFCTKAVNEKQYDSIKRDMTYKQVVDILGGEGAECSLGGLPNDYSHPTVIRRWANSDGSCVQVVINGEDKVNMAIFYEAD